MVNCNHGEDNDMLSTGQRHQRDTKLADFPDLNLQPYEKTAGFFWKVHLSILKNQEPSREQIAKWLQANQRQGWKGAMGGADFTVYVGSRQEMEQFVERIERAPFIESLAVSGRLGNEIESDIVVGRTGKVCARFDENLVHRYKPLGIDMQEPLLSGIEMNGYYGAPGLCVMVEFPYLSRKFLPSDMAVSDMTWKNFLRHHAQMTHELLVHKYGRFYIGDGVWTSAFNDKLDQSFGPLRDKDKDTQALLTLALEKGRKNVEIITQRACRIGLKSLEQPLNQIRIKKRPPPLY